MHLFSITPIRNSFFIFCIVIVLISCNNKHMNPLEELFETDRAMSTLATDIGFDLALLQYADSEMIKFNDNSYPIVGKINFEKNIQGKPVIKSLTWEPIGGEVAASGDLGYTWGNWKMQLHNSVKYGNYFTVWKKQSDGRWKFVLDGGNTTPAPLK